MCAIQAHTSRSLRFPAHMATSTVPLDSETNNLMVLHFDIFLSGHTVSLLEVCDRLNQHHSHIRFTPPQKQQLFLDTSVYLKDGYIETVSTRSLLSILILRRTPIVVTYHPAFTSLYGLLQAKYPLVYTRSYMPLKVQYQNHL